MQFFLAKYNKSLFSQPLRVLTIFQCTASLILIFTFIYKHPVANRIVPEAVY